MNETQCLRAFAEKSNGEMVIGAHQILEMVDLLEWLPRLCDQTVKWSPSPQARRDARDVAEKFRIFQEGK